ncbi:hypothetical protein HYS54_02810 [Candidatus Micrarchaeota archaeon]|nr:hypothetical protein [Candidatus Micrarchaeota archaeon]
MEGVPLRLLISILIAAAALSLSFYALATFNNLSAQKQFADDIIRLRDGIDSLASIGDYGSFSKVRLRVPQGSKLELNNTTNVIRVDFFGENKSFNVSATIVWNRTYPAGDYRIELYYGDPANVASRENDSMLAAFR